MSFTYDLSTNIGKVRNFIDDTDAASYQITDEEINSFLSITSDDLFLTASYCLRKIAASKILLAKRISAGNYSEDTTSLAKDLLALAKEFKQMSDETPAYAQAEMIMDNFSYNEIMVNKYLRKEND